MGGLTIGGSWPKIFWGIIKFWRATKNKTVTIFSFSIEHFKFFWWNGTCPLSPKCLDRPPTNSIIKSLMLNVNQLIYIMIFQNFSNFNKIFKILLKLEKVSSKILSGPANANWLIILSFKIESEISDLIVKSVKLKRLDWAIVDRVKLCTRRKTYWAICNQWPKNLF